MGKPHPVELRQRVVDHVAEGNTHRSAAARFKISVRFVNDMVKLKAATGGLAPKAQGNGGGHGKLSSLKDWIARRIAEKRDLTAAALATEIAATHGVAVHRGTVWQALRDLDLIPTADSSDRWYYTVYLVSGKPGAVQKTTLHEGVASP